jgi:hypothetical protein
VLKNDRTVPNFSAANKLVKNCYLLLMHVYGMYPVIAAFKDQNLQWHCTYCSGSVAHTALVQ